MKTVQIFGDSVLKGVMYDDAQNKYKLCKDKLSIPGVEIRNHSKMGATIEDGLYIMEKRLDDCDKDTLAVIELGGNDCNYNWAEIAARPDDRHLCAVEPGPFTQKLQTAITMLRKTGATVVLASLVPLYAPKFMNWIAKGLNYDNILHWLGDVDHLFRWQDYYSGLVVETAAKNGCPVLDLRGDFLQKGYGDWLCADGIHPTRTGHQKIHQSFAGFLGQMA